ncbi:hypothetical protein N7456_010309 [Penicillium angulare]|uniref:Azaphilone pigments biosynthesis cluster protein L N-terminal domain-containing protein n=1 Tax=Penicillium angulare TaxID=116970 RepID=A0A9W9F6C6_9EURO|nr:hypothetical protein N7456_010309 [Penicillium angulare]
MSGLEALGVAASIIQVADLGATLSVKLFSFYQRFKSSNDSIQLLSTEIALVSAILRELGDNLKKEDAAKLCSAEAFRTLNQVLDQSRGILTEIKKLIDDNDQSASGRFQRITGKFRIALLEPDLDRLKGSLERLKSTMLLLLNVISYAVQIRNHSFPPLIQEQRDFIQSVLANRDMKNLQTRELDSTDSEGVSTDRAYRKSRRSRTKRTSSKKADPIKPRTKSSNQNTSRDQSPSISDNSQYKIKNGKVLVPRNRSTASLEVDGSTESDSSILDDEVEDYDALIRSILNEIESCRDQLDKERHSRLRNGVLNVHSGEIMRLLNEHGDSLVVDYSLFEPSNGNKKMSEGSRRARITSPTVKLKQIVHNVYFANPMIFGAVSSSVESYSDSEDSHFSGSESSSVKRFWASHRVPGRQVRRISEREEGGFSISEDIPTKERRQITSRREQQSLARNRPMKRHKEQRVRQQGKKHDGYEADGEFIYSSNTPHPVRASIEDPGNLVSRQPLSEDLSLPGTLETLLKQWTTLDSTEIQRGQMSFF